MNNLKEYATQVLKEEFRENLKFEVLEVRLETKEMDLNDYRDWDECLHVKVKTNNVYWGEKEKDMVCFHYHHLNGNRPEKLDWWSCYTVGPDGTLS